MDINLVIFLATQPRIGDHQTLWLIFGYSSCRPQPGTGPQTRPPLEIGLFLWTMSLDIAKLPSPNLEVVTPRTIINMHRMRSILFLGAWRLLAASLGF